MIKRLPIDLQVLNSKQVFYIKRLLADKRQTFLVKYSWWTNYLDMSPVSPLQRWTQIIPLGRPKTRAKIWKEGMAPFSETTSQPPQICLCLWCCSWAWSIFMQSVSLGETELIGSTRAHLLWGSSFLIFLLVSVDYV